MVQSIRITGIYDNTKVKDSLISGWGFSVLISGPDYRILFDTGADLKVLSHNMEELGVSPETLDSVFLSHPHCDHLGGLSVILDGNSHLRVYLTESFPRSLMNKIKDYGAEPVIVSEPEKLMNGIYTTGEMHSTYRRSKLPEQSLILESERGPLVISGCAHPGITRIVQRAGKIMERSLHLVLGGFHLGGAREEEIEEVVSKLTSNSIEKFAPTHCTGEKAIAMMKEEFQECFLEFGAGKEILI